MLPTDAVLFEDPGFKVKLIHTFPTPSLLPSGGIILVTMKHLQCSWSFIRQSNGSVWFPFTYIALQVYAEKYVEDQEAFFKDYAEAHAKLSNLGAKFDPPEVCRPG